MEKKITDFIDAAVIYDPDGQYIWINNQKKGLQKLADIRGWGAIQNIFPKTDTGTTEAYAFQDKIGQWIALAINEKLERDASQKNTTESPTYGNLSDIPDISRKEKELWLTAFFEKYPLKDPIDLLDKSNRYIDDLYHQYNSHCSKFNIEILTK